MNFHLRLRRRPSSLESPVWVPSRPVANRLSHTIIPKATVDDRNGTKDPMDSWTFFFDAGEGRNDNEKSNEMSQSRPLVRRLSEVRN
jgi:hypothetical protein